MRLDDWYLELHLVVDSEVVGGVGMGDVRINVSRGIPDLHFGRAVPALLI